MIIHTLIKLYLLMSQFKDLFKRLLEKTKGITDYWKKSPTTKIVLINAGVYVCLISYSACGSFELSPKIF